MDYERLEVFQELFREEPPLYIRELEKKALENQVPIIKRGTRDVIRFLLKTNEPKSILEIGTAIGYSSLFMKENISKDALITTIEKVPARIKTAKENFDKYDYNKQIQLLEGDASQILLNLIKENKKYDFIFMDAAKGQYLTFLDSLVHLLEKKAVLLSDNIFHDGDIFESRYAVKRRDRTIHSRMRDYIKKLKSFENMETICLPIGDGITISKCK